MRACCNDSTINKPILSEKNGALYKFKILSDSSNFREKLKIEEKSVQLFFPSDYYLIGVCDSN